MRGLLTALAVILWTWTATARPDPLAERLAERARLAKVVAPESRAKAAKQKVCEKAYTRLYAKPELEIRVVFGYKDARPARFVGDRHERLLFTQVLSSPCPEGFHACGFKRSLDDADLFRKTISGPGDVAIRVRVRVTHSSSGSDDEANRADPFQKWQSAQAREMFYKGFQDADAVFYNGHSRAGGGPDFDPPKLFASGEIDFNHYTRERPGLKETLAALGSVKTGGLRVLGLFSCISSQHFGEQILQKKPGLSMVTSRQLIYWVDALENSLMAISGLLERQCEGEIKTAIRHQSLREGSQWTGFFVE